MGETNSFRHSNNVETIFLRHEGVCMNVKKTDTNTCAQMPEDDERMVFLLAVFAPSCEKSCIFAVGLKEELTKTTDYEISETTDDGCGLSVCNHRCGTA